MESYSFGRYGYREIDSQESLDTLFEKYEWFHDTIIKEIHINNLIYMSDTAIVCVADDHNYSARVVNTRGLY